MTARTSIAGKRPSNQRGYTYLMALAAMVIVGIFAEAASVLTTRTVYADKEAELLFRGMVYRNAIRSYHQAGGTYPRGLDDLLKDPRSPNRRHLRALYPDPMAKEGQGWLLINAADGGIAGVASRSREEPLKKANFPQGFEKFEGASAYNEWIFEYVPGSLQSPGAGAPAPKTN